MKLPERQSLHLSDVVRALPDDTQLPITPSPDAMQLHTTLIYPDIAQLPTKPIYPDGAQLPTKPAYPDTAQLITKHTYPDITQLITKHTYPDITQLPTRPLPPGIPSTKIPLRNQYGTSSVGHNKSLDAIPSTDNHLNPSRLLLYAKIALLFLSGLVIPFLLYTVLADFSFNITRMLYYIIIISILVNFCNSLGIPTLVGLHIKRLPVRLATLYPAASAIITACLPEDAATIIETVRSVLRVNYPVPLQVILAYSTPHALPVEGALKQFAAHDRRLILLRIEHSTSKAENIHRALHEVTGTFVGIFDADHHPALDSFKRAWNWLAHDYHVVQGRNVVRNGDHSWIAHLLAVESELLYALEYSGHARMFDFGIFEGTNGYWSTDLLRKIDMNSFMLADGVDSSMRALQLGYKIMHDPLLISRGLAPETLQAFWNQRMRQARGRFQASLVHFWTNLSSPLLSFRQKLGSFHLLIWHEISVWLSFQLFPILAFQVIHGEWPQFAPLFILSSAFTIGIRLLQILLAYSVALPEIRKHPGWFISYAILSLFFFTELKNHIARIAQLQEL